MSITIHTVQYAESFLREDLIFRGGSRERELPIVFCLYLIETEGKKILVDAGCKTMPGFDIRNFSSPVEALRREGFSPEEITDLVITHAHHDHIECAKDFPGALVHIQREEAARAQKRQYLPTELTLNLFDSAFHICEGVDVLCIGGHSIGSSIVTVAAEHTTYVIAGDECYKQECLIRQIPTGSSVCPEKSQAFIQTYRAPEYTVLLAHDRNKTKGNQL
ncbi:MAG: MBL fold metallo-hydrolase [Clostridia bacterium]|nr:MBL fold metallo-hydrolase [Clostridia bacterium]